MSRLPSSDPPQRSSPAEVRVGDLVDDALRRLGVRRAVREAQLRDLLADVLGPALAPLCASVSLDRGTLSVATTHPALAHQLRLDAPRIVAALNERLGTDAVRRLRLVASTPR